MILLSEFDSPLSKLTVAERGRKVLAISFGGKQAMRAEHPEIWQLGEVVQGTIGPSAQAISDYLLGSTLQLRVSFDPALVRSDFDRLVLRRLTLVRAGQTVSYGELAELVGRPGAARAVGSAMRRNPVPIVVPCHRVLPKSGALGNYTGGVSKKRWLLAREGSRFTTC